MFRRLPLVIGLGALVLAVPLFLRYASYLWSHDPFAKYFGSWSDPLGGNVGSQMLEADVKVFDGQDPVLAFRAERIDVRRDRQFMQLDAITDGQVFEEGKPTAEFGAGAADVDVATERIRVRDDVWLSGHNYRITTSALDIGQNNQTMYAEGGVKGTYERGSLSAASLQVGFGGGPSKAVEFLWIGPVEVQGQGTRKLQVRGDRWESFTNPDREVWTNAEAIDQDAMMRCRSLTWDREADVITMEGNCEYHGPDAVVSAPKITIYRKEKRAVATGDVRVLVKPENEKGAATLPPAEPVLPKGLQQPKTSQKEIDDELRSGKSLRKYPMMITCTKVEYFYAKGKKKAVLTGTPKARQELRAGSWREMTAPTAVYEEEKELLTMMSGAGGRDVRMKNSAGDDLTAESLVISTVQGSEKMTGTRIEGVMRVRDEDDGGG